LRHFDFTQIPRSPGAYPSSHDHGAGDGSPL